MCCIYLLQHHVAVERNIRVLFDAKADDLPVHKIRNGFYHYMALKDTSYCFTCARCGVHPTVIVADGNWKNSCLRPSKVLSQQKIYDWQVIIGYNQSYHRTTPKNKRAAVRLPITTKNW